MNINSFLTCLGYYGVSTGASTSLDGAYAFASGLSGVIFNQLYPTGVHFISGQIYGPIIPLINVYPNSLINNTFSGSNGYRVGYQHTGNFSILMDVSYSGCNRPTMGKGMILLSTVTTPSGLSSGFVVGITESNRLYFNTSGYSKTLEREFTTRDFVHVSLASQRYVTIGIFSLNDNALYKQSIVLPSQSLNSQDLYIGNFLYNSPSSPYTGFSGQINQAVLFHNTLIDSDVGTCANCALTTAFNTGVSTLSFVAQQITGSYLSGVYANVITGYTNLTTSVTMNNGSPINVIVPSGLTGLVQTGVFSIPMFSGVTIQDNRNAYYFTYDQNALNAFSTFFLRFDLGLSSGDWVDVYTYNQANTNVGLSLSNLNYPTDSGIVQLICNGLDETLGTDYYVNRNMISGLHMDDLLSYDIMQSPSIVTSYSGYWSDGSSRISVSGQGYFPPTSQYLEDINNFPGVIMITGFTGLCVNNPFYPKFGYDLYVNGQKLISGMHYNIWSSGTIPFIVEISGWKLPQLIIGSLYDWTGGGPTGIAYVDVPELSFIPQYSGFVEALYNASGNVNIVGPFTGFGEQVWFNGLRQVRNMDYNKIFPCSLNTGTYSAQILNFTCYDSTAGNNSTWNLVTPPNVTCINSGASDIMWFTPTLSNINGYPTGGLCIEIWAAQGIALGKVGPMVYQGIFPYATTALLYNGWYSTPAYSGYAQGMARYHSGNTIGPMWSGTMFLIDTSILYRS